EIYRVTFGEQLAQGLDAPVQLGAQFHLFLDHRSAAQNDGISLVVGFQRRKIQIDSPHVVVGVDVEYGGDACFAAEALDIVNGSGMRSNKQPRKDLRVS